MLKHSLLIFCIDYLSQKEKPFLCIDTHAGAGFYPLHSGYALQNREWENGIARLKELNSRDFPSMINRYVNIALSDNCDFYNGSSGIMKKLVRPQDRLCSFELHPVDFNDLQSLLKETPNAKALNEDGLNGLVALLPPISRRACIFIDPSYEIKSDYEVLPVALSKALKRFPQGLYIIWHPLLRNEKKSLHFTETLESLYLGNRCSISFCTNTSKNMYGSGIVIYNPPWTLKNTLEESLEFLAALFDGKWTVSWDGRN